MGFCVLLTLFAGFLWGDEARAQTDSPATVAKRHLDRGKLALEDGNLQEACFEFQSATRVLPNWWIPHQEYVRCARILGVKPGVLLQELDRILGVDPNRPSLHFLRGVLLEDGERMDLALASYATALRLAPWMTEVTSRYALILLRTGRLQQAQEAYESALQKRPDSILLLNNLALSYEREAKYVRAIPYLKRLVLQSHYPKHVLARLAHAYKSLGNESEVRRIIHRLKK